MTVLRAAIGGEDQGVATDDPAVQKLQEELHLLQRQAHLLRDLEVVRSALIATIELLPYLKAVLVDAHIHTVYCKYKWKTIENSTIRTTSTTVCVPSRLTSPRIARCSACA